MTKNLKDLRDGAAVNCGCMTNVSERDKFDIGRISFTAGFDACDNAYKEIMDKMEKQLTQEKEAAQRLVEALEFYGEPLIYVENENGDKKIDYMGREHKACQALAEYSERKK